MDARPASFPSISSPSCRRRCGTGPNGSRAPPTRCSRTCTSSTTQKPDYVAVFGADHVYRMDVRQMIEAHIERDADVDRRGLAGAGRQEQVVRHRRGRRPTCGSSTSRRSRRSAESMPGRPGYAMASMGNYIFSADVLVEELRRAHELEESDFGRTSAAAHDAHAPPVRLRLRQQRGSRPGRPRGAQLLARRRHDRRLFRRPHGHHRRALEVLHDQHRSGPSTPAPTRPRAPRSRAASSAARSSARAASSTRRVLDHTMLRRSVTVETGAYARSMRGHGAQRRRHAAHGCGA